MRESTKLHNGLIITVLRAVTLVLTMVSGFACVRESPISKSRQDELRLSERPETRPTKDPEYTAMVEDYRSRLSTAISHKHYSECLDILDEIPVNPRLRSAVQYDLKRGVALERLGRDKEALESYHLAFVNGKNKIILGRPRNLLRYAFLCENFGQGKTAERVFAKLAPMVDLSEEPYVETLQSTTSGRRILAIVYVATDSPDKEDMMRLTQYLVETYPDDVFVKLVYATSAIDAGYILDGLEAAREGIPMAQRQNLKSLEERFEQVIYDYEGAATLSKPMRGDQGQVDFGPILTWDEEMTLQREHSGGS